MCPPRDTHLDAAAIPPTILRLRRRRVTRHGLMLALPVLAVLLLIGL